MEKQLENALIYSHTLLRKVVHAGDCVVDATVGNGHDTEFLAQLVGKNGQVYGFDIQREAILAATERLTKAKLMFQTTLFHQGHETCGDSIPKKQPIQAAIFNLGYLPTGDKTKTTTGETTKNALITLLSKLATGGLIIMVLYDGHPAGITETALITTYTSQLPQTKYQVLSYQFINQSHHPAKLIAIEKL